MNDIKKLSKKELIALLNEKEQQLSVAKSENTKKSVIIISTDKNSVLHINTDSNIAQALRNSQKSNEFILSDKFENNVTSNNYNCEVVRVTLSFREFCKNAIIKALNEK
jgi:hypothetical protein